MMHLMLETILAGRLLGVDPFDQPAVELSKVITRERLTQSLTLCAGPPERCAWPFASSHRRPSTASPPAR